MPVFQLTDHIIFPPPEMAEESGLLAVGGDLSVERLVAAYRRGIFPWYSEGDPILWWFTSPRLVLFPDELRISARLARYRRNSAMLMTIDQAFGEVVENCAETRRSRGEGTWITAAMKAAYQRLHERGYAHSVECWLADELVGGLYGIALGKVFFGESMFSAAANSSKLALLHLVDFLKANGYQLIDCQMTTGHMVSLGAREIPGKQFQYLLRQHIRSNMHDGAWPDGKNG